MNLLFRERIGHMMLGRDGGHADGRVLLDQARSSRSRCSRVLHDSVFVVRVRDRARGRARLRVHALPRGARSTAGSKS